MGPSGGWRRLAIGLLLVAPLASACTSGSGQGETPKTTPAASSSAAPASGPVGFADVAEQVSPSVVTVRTSTGLGSGVVLHDDVVVTNQHVVGQQRDVTVVFADGTDGPGQVLATDPVTDIAVIRTDRGKLPVPQFRQDLPRPGEPALAIGSPLGFENSVTAGVISGLHREIPGSASQTASLVDLIQTDASISPGNSGGALLDAQGRVVGLNEAYIPPSAGAVSIGFAIPTATVLDVAGQLLANGQVKHPYLGLTVGRLTPAIRQQLGVPVDAGALVVGLDQGGPAASAGVRTGDVITRFGNTQVNSVEDLLAALRAATPGQQAVLSLARGSQRPQVTVTLGSRPS